MYDVRVCNHPLLLPAPRPLSRGANDPVIYILGVSWKKNPRMHPNPPPKTQHIAQVGKFSSRHRRRNKSVSPFPFSLLLFSPFVYAVALLSSHCSFFHYLSFNCSFFHYNCSSFIPLLFLPLPLVTFHLVALSCISIALISIHCHFIAVSSVTIAFLPFRTAPPPLDLLISHN